MATSDLYMKICTSFDRERPFTIAARSALRSGPSGRGSALFAPPASAPGSARRPVPVPTGSATGLDSGDTEAQDAVPEARREPAAVRRPRVERAVEPAPAPVHPDRGLGGTE